MAEATRSVRARRWALLLPAALLTAAPFVLSAPAQAESFDCTRAPSAEHPDTDGDGLCDDEESAYGSNPTKVDTDGDGLRDGFEVIIIGSNPTVADTDADALSDGEEVLTYDTNPLRRDTDGDTVADGYEVRTSKTDPNDPDTDGDLFGDGTELRNSTDPLNPFSFPAKVGNLDPLPEQGPIRDSKPPYRETPVVDTVDPVF